MPGHLSKYWKLEQFCFELNFTVQSFGQNRPYAATKDHYKVFAAKLNRGLKLPLWVAPEL